MDTTRSKKPAYRRQKRRGKSALAFINLNGIRRYLGEYGSAESHQRYAAAIAEWESSGRLPPADREDLRVLELVDRHWTFAEKHYRRPDGTPTSELDLIKRALAVLTSIYGELPAKDFSPLKLKAVRQKMIERGWARKVVNNMVQRIRRAFRWAAENELVRPEVHHGLQAVAGLKAGRCDAPDHQPVRPVPDGMLCGVLDLKERNRLAPQIEGMIRLQLLTGARPGEICGMRTCDIDAQGGVWIFRPGSHKNQHHGHEREIYLGPKAQRVLSPFLKPDLQAHVFSPADATAWRLERRHAARKTPQEQGNRPGSNITERPRRKPGVRYTVTSYRRAIARACDVAFPPPKHLQPATLPNGKQERSRVFRARLTAEQKKELRQWRRDHRWHPHQLRHNAATLLRREFGIEVAQTILGHRLGSGITEIYAEANVTKAKQVIQKIG